MPPLRFDHLQPEVFRSIHSVWCYYQTPNDRDGSVQVPLSLFFVVVHALPGRAVVAICAFRAMFIFFV